MKPDSKSNPQPEPLPQQLREALHLDKLILASGGEGIYGRDPEGKTTLVNQAAEDMCGFSAREVIGNCQHHLVHHSKPDGTPYPQEECPIYAAFRKGKVFQTSEEVGCYGETNDNE